MSSSSISPASVSSSSYFRNALAAVASFARIRSCAICTPPVTQMGFRFFALGMMRAQEITAPGSATFVRFLFKVTYPIGGASMVQLRPVCAVNAYPVAIFALRADQVKSISEQAYGHSNMASCWPGDPNAVIIPRNPSSDIAYTYAGLPAPNIPPISCLFPQKRRHLVGHRK